MTYDSPELQRAFQEEFGVTIPLLSDVNGVSMQALGILNTEYEPGHDNYGIPWPGIFIVDRNMTIAGKIFVEGFMTRVSAEGVLAYANEVLGGD